MEIQSRNHKCFFKVKKKIKTKMLMSTLNRDKSFKYKEFSVCHLKNWLIKHTKKKTDKKPT